jgi:hypothetical protein
MALGIGSDGVTIDVDDLLKTMADLSKATRQVGGAMRKGNLEVARKFEGWARADASAGTGQQRHFADALLGSATRTGARLTIRGKPKTEFAGAWGAFFGSKKFKRFPPWVGNSWPYASRTEGPQPVNSTLATHTDEIGDLLISSREAAMRDLFKD